MIESGSAAPITVNPGLYIGCTARYCSRDRRIFPGSSNTCAADGITVETTKNKQTSLSITIIGASSYRKNATKFLWRGQFSEVSA
jgi:hypothetical protein